jgi:hypothetical protein
MNCKSTCGLNDLNSNLNKKCHEELPHTHKEGKIVPLCLYCKEKKECEQFEQWKRNNPNAGY